MSVKSRLKEVRDVIILARKPDGKEFSFSLKISIIGILLVGLIAFTIQLLMTTLLSLAG
ncbi:MAG: protein translocase SEC61 complex subunit gamma [Candidatus Marsarchaeota archaeon]|nr:protein translocase SEC61 complex subunit gamma [Candidatus Marsarchaeota archaeon]